MNYNSVYSLNKILYIYSATSEGLWSARFQTELLRPGEATESTGDFRELCTGVVQISTEPCTPFGPLDTRGGKCCPKWTVHKKIIFIYFFFTLNWVILQYIGYLQLCSNVWQNKLSRRQQEYVG